MGHIASTDTLRTLAGPRSWRERFSGTCGQRVDWGIVNGGGDIEDGFDKSEIGIPELAERMVGRECGGMDEAV